MDNIRKIMIAEKIPAIVCAMACMASVLIGFGMGYIFFTPGEQIFAYTEPQYQYNEPYLAIYPQPYEPQTQPAPDKPSYLYVVTTLDGYIVVYHAREYGGEIKELTNTSICGLAPEEQERLATGIPIYSDEALARILQDYGS